MYRLQWSWDLRLMRPAQPISLYVHVCTLCTYFLPKVMYQINIDCNSVALPLNDCRGLLPWIKEGMLQFTHISPVTNCSSTCTTNLISQLPPYYLPIINHISTCLISPHRAQQMWKFKMRHLQQFSFQPLKSGHLTNQDTFFCPKSV